MKNTLRANFIIIFFLVCSFNFYAQVEVFFAEVDSNYVTLYNSYAYRNCCAEYDMQINQDDFKIDWIQYDTGFTCVCVCNFDLSVSFGPLNDGYYYAEIYYTCAPDYPCDTVYLTTIEFEINTDQITDFASVVDEFQSACYEVSIQEINIIKGIISSPNPFTTSTTLSYELKQPEKVTLTIYDYLGKQVYQTQENQPQGKQQLIWNAEVLPDGIYYYRLQAGEQTANGKMVKVRL